MKNYKGIKFRNNNRKMSDLSDQSDQSGVFNSIWKKHKNDIGSNTPDTPDWSDRIPFTEFVLETLKTLNKHLNPCPYNDLFNEVSHQVEKDQLKEILDYLKKNGQVMEVKPKMFVVV